MRETGFLFGKPKRGKASYLVSQESSLIQQMKLKRFHSRLGYFPSNSSIFGKPNRGKASYLVNSILNSDEFTQSHIQTNIPMLK